MLAQRRKMRRLLEPPYHFEDIPKAARDLKASVVVPVNDRQVWLDHLASLLLLCTEASRRHAGKCTDRIERSIAASKPLALEYIADRFDLDDPCNGYMVRTKEEGWLQGFITFTTFTTWQRHFKWDSLCDEAGLFADEEMTIEEVAIGDDMKPHVRVVTSPPPPSPSDGEGDEGAATKHSHKLDEDGSLARELESQIRWGNPDAEGVIWPHVAEVALLGGLGCGGKLLSLLINDLEMTTDYDYVVLQATENSIGFYEHHGFIRIGAVSNHVVGNARMSSHVAANTAQKAPANDNHRHEEDDAEEEEDWDMEEGTEAQYMLAAAAARGKARKSRAARMKAQMRTPETPGQAIPGNLAFRWGDTHVYWRASLSDETPSSVAARCSKNPACSRAVNPQDVVFLNRDVFPNLTANAKLVEGTMLLVPEYHDADAVVASNGMPSAGAGAATSSGEVADSEDVPALSTSSSPSSARGSRSERAWARRRRTRRWYVSSENEQIKRIAAKLGVDAAELVSLNLAGEHALGGLTIKSRLLEGTRLRVPRDDAEEKLMYDFDLPTAGLLAYRHWTFPDEPIEYTEASHMMARRLKHPDTKTTRRQKDRTGRHALPWSALWERAPGSPRRSPVQAGRRQAVSSSASSSSYFVSSSSAQRLFAKGARGKAVAGDSSALPLLVEEDPELRFNLKAQYARDGILVSTLPPVRATREVAPPSSDEEEDFVFLPPPHSVRPVVVIASPTTTIENGATAGHDGTNTNGAGGAVPSVVEISSASSTAPLSTPILSSSSSFSSTAADNDKVNTTGGRTRSGGRGRSGTDQQGQEEKRVLRRMPTGLLKARLPTGSASMCGPEVQARVGAAEKNVWMTDQALRKAIEVLNAVQAKVQEAGVILRRARLAQRAAIKAGKQAEPPVGTRIEVYWKDDQRFYPGVVSAFDATTGIHSVLYDDGDVETLNMKTQRWRDEVPVMSSSSSSTSLSCTTTPQGRHKRRKIGTGSTESATSDDGAGASGRLGSSGKRKRTPSGAASGGGSKKRAELNTGAEESGEGKAMSSEVAAAQVRAAEAKAAASTAAEEYRARRTDARKAIQALGRIQTVKVRLRCKSLKSGFKVGQNALAEAKRAAKRAAKAQQRKADKEARTYARALARAEKKRMKLLLKKRKKKKKRPSLFNKVVTVKDVHPASAVSGSPYYFVLTYIPDLAWAHLVPMRPDGVFSFTSEKRGGRPRWKTYPEGDPNGTELHVSATRCTPVKVNIVGHTKDADKETWDILTDYSTELGRRMLKGEPPDAGEAAAPVPAEEVTLLTVRSSGASGGGGTSGSGRRGGGGRNGKKDQGKVKPPGPRTSPTQLLMSAASDVADAARKQVQSWFKGSSECGEKKNKATAVRNKTRKRGC